jgi:hypothetical protein
MLRLESALVRPRWNYSIMVLGSAAADESAV